MKARAWTAIVMLPILWGILGDECTRPAQLGAAWAAKPVGHPPPAVTLEEDAPDLEEILERYVDAAGGRDAIAAIERRLVRGRIVTDLPTWDPPVYEIDTLTIYSEAPDRYLVVHRTAKGRTLEGCDGTAAWRRDVDGKASGFEGVGGGDAWLVDPRYPLRLREYFPDMTYLGTARLAGRRVHVVDVDGAHLHRLYFDAETGLLARLGYNTTIMRYEEVDGVEVPFEVEYSRKGGSSTFILESVVHAVPIDPRLFAAPVSY